LQYFKDQKFQEFNKFRGINTLFCVVALSIKGHEIYLLFHLIDAAAETGHS